MSEPTSPPPVGTEPALPAADPTSAAVATSQPLHNAVTGDTPAAELAAASTRSTPLPVRAQRIGQRKTRLETVSWVGTQSRGLMQLLRNKLFMVTVVIPTLASAVYFGAIASDVYISESRFVIRTPQRTQQPSLVGALLQGSGFMRAQDDAFTLHDFFLSRDALSVLDAKLQLRTAFSSKDVDTFNRFPGPGGDESFESLFKYYTRRVGVEYDATSSITTLRVNAYTARDALAINAGLLALGEGLVNQINERGRQDLIKYAVTEVADAESKAKAAAVALAGYRNQRSVFDPERQSALQLQQVSKLQDELIATKMQVAQIEALSPQNPQLSSLRKRARGLEREMASEMGKVAGGGGNSLSNKAADFERLSLERAFADRQVASALTSLESARNEARRKQLYLERIVQPNLPDYALEPRRLRNVLATLVLGLVAWGIAGMLLSGVKEHQA